MWVSKHSSTATKVFVYYTLVIYYQHKHLSKGDNVMATTKKKSVKTTKKKVTKTVARPKAAARQEPKKPGFTSVRFNEQTVYWIIFGVATLAITIWLLSMYAKTLQIYDDIRSTNSGSVVKSVKNQ